MSKICLCLTAKTLYRNIEILNKYKKFADIAELRVDCLNDDERLYIRRFPELASLPVILTIRRDTDGGFFVGGEGARIKLLARGLAFANADRRMNFAYVDIEDDIEVPSLEEAARTFGTRIIRSFHDLNGDIHNVSNRIKSMQRIGDEILKIAIKVNTTNDVLNVYNGTRINSPNDKIIICMGHLGIYSRILADRFGSFLTYASALTESEVPAAPGQLDIQDMAELYRLRKINNKTNVFGLLGHPLKASFSPWFFNTIFNNENLNAVYVPFPADSVKDMMALAKELDIQGLSVTVPYKEAILPALSKSSRAVQCIGACNTMTRTPTGWYGENTDSTGFSDSLLEFLGKTHLKKQKITIIGAGGAARAAAAEIFRLGGKALIINRTITKARNVASVYDFKWAGMDSQGIREVSKYNDVIIQTTSLGMEGYEETDPLEAYTFTGKEAVMDLIYIPAETEFLKRAKASGCRTLNGLDMLIRQACLQYTSFLGKDVPHQFLTRIKTSGEKLWNTIRSG